MWFWEVFHYVLSLLFHLIGFESVLGVEFCCQITQHPTAAAPGQHTEPAAKNPAAPSALTETLLSQQAGEHQPWFQLCQDAHTHIASQAQCQAQH